MSKGPSSDVHMVNIEQKPIVSREAEAAGEIHLQQATLSAITTNQIEKGNVLATAQIAGILAVKKTAEIIPLCHPIPITQVNVQFKVQKEKIIAHCTVSAKYRTGVEMEALLGVTTALLTIWDMVKYMEKDAEGQYPRTHISNVKVIQKWKEA